MNTTTANDNPPAITTLQQRFLVIVPRIEAHGQVYFRHLKCPIRREDAVAEMTALSWKWFRRLVEKGKRPETFVSAIASFTARAVRSGRQLCGQEKAKDVMSPRAQRIHAFHVGKLPDYSALSCNPLAEALTDNTQTPPDVQAVFRCDFPAWLVSLGDRKRRIAEDLMVGERTLDVADRHRVSAARISQMRREFQSDWERFTDAVEV